MRETNFHDFKILKQENDIVIVPQADLNSTRS